MVPQGGLRFRSIPACAGEPVSAAGTTPNLGVYPRVCGGTQGGQGGQGGVCGLSPRVRGNLAALVITWDWPGSIPACAGEPGSRGDVMLRGQVYPRVCGGTLVTQRARADVGGLSPRVRGNRGAACSSFVSFGSIPACAGEPPLRGAAPAGGWVYPRVCGGTSISPSFPVDNRGLSPRVRGNPQPHLQ